MSLVLSNMEERGVCTLTLNRPEKMNAFSTTMLQDLLARAQELGADKNLRAVVLRSATPKAFGSGADLTERMAMDVSQVSETLKLQRQAIEAVAAIPVPVIAVLEGIVFGGGLELALACDMRVCAPTAKLGLTEAKLAIIPGAGGTQRLARLIGAARAKKLIYCGRRLTGEEALTVGLVHACVADPFKHAAQWVDEILEAGPLAIRAAKAAIDGGYGKPMSEALDWERSCYEQVLNSKDRLEGLKAFSEKRKSQYTGE